MVEPIKITNDIKMEHQNRIDEIVEKQNRSIKSAIERNCHSACFVLDKYDSDYIEVRNIFERAGYVIKPTGYIGGVWQSTEDICW